MKQLVHAYPLPLSPFPSLLTHDYLYRLRINLHSAGGENLNSHIISAIYRTEATVGGNQSVWHVAGNGAKFSPDLGALGAPFLIMPDVRRLLPGHTS